jgi:hypothetical protein
MKANASKMMEAVIRVLINEGKSATFATLKAVVEVDQVQKIVDKESGLILAYNPFWLGRGNKPEIRKRTTYNPLLNVNYERLVNSGLVKEGKTPDFQSVPNWMTKIHDTDNGNICTHKADAVVDEKGNFIRFTTDNPRLYIMCYLKGANKSKTTDYYINGVLATPEQVETIKKFIPKPKEAEQGGLEEKVVVRTITIYNAPEHKGIEYLACGGLQVEFDKIL